MMMRVIERVAWIFVLVATLTFLMMTMAFALDFSQEIKGMDDEPLVTGGKPVTLGTSIAAALFGAWPGDEKLTGEEKFERGMLALKVRGGGDVQLTAEEITMIKGVVAKAYGPLMVTRIWPLLDPGVPTNKVKTETIPAPEGKNGGGY